MFPLNTVVFPGVVLPLFVFEDRYRRLIHQLLLETNPALRLFGSVGIREGYEIGDHGAQSLYRVGCRLQLTDVTAHEDGSFDVIAVARDRLRVLELDPTGDFPVADVDLLPTAVDALDEASAAGAARIFQAYRRAVAGLRDDPHPEALPGDPEFLSWTLAAAAPLPMSDRQALLECDEVGARLALLTDLLREELRAMQVVPSLPATEVARTRWSPN
jgi:uncharacterized protein